MKRNAIARIIIYSILVLVLTGILLAGIAVNGFIFNLGTSGGTVVENTAQVDASGIRSVHIEWVSGSVTIRRGDTDQIIFSEKAPEDTKYQMTYDVQGSTLKLSYSKGKVSFGFGNFSIPSKDLVITVPQDWDCETLEIDGASLKIHIPHLNVEKIKLDGASCNLEFLGSVHYVDVDGASTDLRLECANRPSKIDIDGASCDLEVVLPKGCGFTVNMDGISCDLHTSLPYTSQGDNKVYGDGQCKINIDGASCDVTVREND